MRALVVYCHPRETSFTAAVRDVVLARLGEAGAEVRLTDIYSRGFDYVHFIRGQEGDHFYGNDPVRHLNPRDFHKPIKDPATNRESDISRLSLKELKGYLAQRQYWKTDDPSYGP